MTRLTFVTGNSHKAAYVAETLGVAVGHQKLDLDELQSLDLRVITEHKARQAYAQLHTPVLVEDVSLEFHALGHLPGPFIKWFIEQIGNEQLCHLLDTQDDRTATARICYCLFDGQTPQFFVGDMTGQIVDSPRGDNGFGWDQIFVKDGMRHTRAELDTDSERATSMRRQPLQKLAELLQNNGEPS